MALPRLKRFPKNAYKPIAPRLRGVARTPANKRGWGPGWPNPQTDKLVRIEANRLGGARFRKEIAPLVTYLIKASNALGYDIRKAKETDGGVGSFSNRAIKNSNPPAPSNHSWGLAIDQNTRSNPMSKTWRSTTPPEIVDLWESAGFFWGGRYSGTSWFFDPMHFEYMGKPDDAAKDLKNAQEAFKRLGGTTLYPTLRNGSDNTAMIRVLQARLSAHGFRVDDDGDFGAITEAAVRQFQRKFDLVEDGVVGPATWDALNQKPGSVVVTEPDEPEVDHPEPPEDEEPVTCEQENEVLRAENERLLDELDEVRAELEGLERIFNKYQRIERIIVA